MPYNPRTWKQIRSIRKSVSSPLPAHGVKKLVVDDKGRVDNDSVERVSVDPFVRLMVQRRFQLVECSLRIRSRLRVYLTLRLQAQWWLVWPFLVVRYDANKRVDLG